MGKKEIMQYSTDGINYYKKSEYCNKFNISDSGFKNLLSKHIFYKKVNGIEYKYIHISKSNKCTITFTDCKEVTTVEKLSRKIINIIGCGDYKVTYKDINNKKVILYMTAAEFNTMFGFLVIFQTYGNIDMEKRKAISRFGKGVEFI